MHEGIPWIRGSSKVAYNNMGDECVKFPSAPITITFLIKNALIAQLVGRGIKQGGPRSRSLGSPCLPAVIRYRGGNESDAGRSPEPPRQGGVKGL